MAKIPTQVSHRDSKDGQFVTERYAKSHPATTEREVIKHPPAPPPAPAPARKTA